MKQLAVDMLRRIKHKHEAWDQNRTSQIRAVSALRRTYLREAEVQDVGVEFVYGTGESVAGQIITAELTVQNRNRKQDIYFYIIIKFAPVSASVVMHIILIYSNLI